jgi:hypothetical protein
MQERGFKKDQGTRAEGRDKILQQVGIILPKDLDLVRWEDKNNQRMSQRHIVSAGTLQEELFKVLSSDSDIQENTTEDGAFRMFE